MLTRMFTYFTLFMYLAVGVVAVRVLTPDMTTIEVSSSYLKYFSRTEFKTPEAEAVVAPDIAFNEIKFPVEKKVIVKAPVANKPVVVAQKIQPVSKHELPFHEAVVLSPVVAKEQLETSLVALYHDFKYETAMDAVSTKLAATTEVDAEPEFFEYPVEEAKAEEKKVVETKEEIAAASAPVVDENVEEVNIVDNIPQEDLVAFDYSKAKQDVKEEKVPTVSTVTTQNMLLQGTSAPVTPAAPMTMTNISKSQPKKVQKAVTTHQQNALTNKRMGFVQEESKTYQNRVTIQITGTDFKKTQEEVGFEVRPQDDLSESVSDYNNGSVSIDSDLSQPNMTRSVTVLKRGFAPTNTDLILEEGASEVTIPMVAENTFNEMIAPYESRGPIGVVLVELDDEVESATLDVPYSQVLKLDEDMKITTDSNFTYQLFVGVKAGNAMLSYKSGNGEVTSKIIHVHEHELTFETNFFEPSASEKVTLVEEDLLSKEKMPLILSSDEVRQFATEKTAKKINDHTYKTDFRKTLLGGRKYLELGHQQEPVFVGYKNATTLEIPSENFMRYILSRFEGSKLGNRCLVQVNLSKKASRVDVAAESVGESLQTSTQVLDADGKFYDSVGEKSQKVIVVGENQGSPDYSQDAKINLKITYQDGSIQYLGSYCSPNTYLVEQL